MGSTEKAGLLLPSLHPLVYTDSQEAMLSVFPLHVESRCPLEYFEDMKRRRGWRNMYWIQWLLNHFLPSSLFTEIHLWHLVLIVFVCHDTTLFVFFLLNREKTPSILKSVFLKEVMCLSQDCILLLHLKMFQKIYRTYTPPALSVKCKHNSND